MFTILMSIVLLFLSPTFAAVFQATFRAWDKDGNGKLSKREFWGARALEPNYHNPTPKRFGV